jgi:hypothetical protein
VELKKEGTTGEGRKLHLLTAPITRLGMLALASVPALTTVHGYSECFADDRWCSWSHDSLKGGISMALRAGARWRSNATIPAIPVTRSFNGSPTNAHFATSPPVIVLCFPSAPNEEIVPSTA